MDIYTTSFCLPRNPFLQQVQASSASPAPVSAQSLVDHPNGHGNSASQQSPSLQLGTAVPASTAGSSHRAASPSLSAAESSTRGSVDAGQASTAIVSPAGQSGAGLAGTTPASAQNAPPPTNDTSSIPSSGASTASPVAGAAPNHRGPQRDGDAAGDATNGITIKPGKRLSTTASSVSADAAQAESATSGRPDVNETIQEMCRGAMAAHQCIVSFVNLDPKAGHAFNFHLSGGYQQVMSARGTILRDNPFKRKSIVKVPRSEVLDGKENVKVEMRRKLDEIAGLTKAHLAIVGQVSGSIGFGLETERNVEIVIAGSYESVEQARVRLLVLLDELSGLHSEVCEIDYKLHNIIAGRKRCVIQTIQEETATNIYFPTPLSGVLSTKEQTLMMKQNLIFITGEFFGVQRAREMLFQVSLHKSKCIISRDTAILPRKLDWLLTERLEEMKQIMNDNGTFINLPPIGSQASLISVYGDHRVNIERSIRSVMQLVCQFYVASVWLLPVSFDVFMPPPTINPSQVPSILRHIAVTSGAEAVFKSNCFEIHGLESEVRAAVQLVLELEIVKSFHHEIRFQIELSNEHREFISGKKNGKLNKIMKSANVKIKFETFNDYNFLIDVSGNDQGALHGLSMLQEELPAEISFHVPEGYHKRIIGVGGKNIQRITKKHGVYVKFSNAEEFAALGGYADNEDNVIARTPAKNAMSLEHLKQAVMELVSPKDKDFVTETVAVPRRYHRTLLGEKSIFIHDIESKTNSAVRFPNKETASDLVSIFGPESQVHIAAQMLLDHVPFEAEYRLPHSNEMAALTLSQDFVDLTERIKRDLNIAVLPWVDRSGAGEETIVRFCLNRSNVDFLATARDLLEEYLVQRNITLYPGSLRPRSDSVADAFPFFNSKLLSTVTADAEHRGGSGAAPVEKPERATLHPAASSPSIKALFDGDANGAAAAAAAAAGAAGGLGTSPTHQPPLPAGGTPYGGFWAQPAEQSYPGFYPTGASPTGGQFDNGTWGAPGQMPYMPSSMPFASSPNSIPFPTAPSRQGMMPPQAMGGPAQPQQHRLSGGEAAHKRSTGQADSDDTLKDIQNKPTRGIVGRAQSLDFHAGRSPPPANGNADPSNVHQVSNMLSSLGL